ncbi:MAG: hypothetical protein ABIG03_04345 [Candidatus Eisenbacteria bacterium]
MRYRRSSLLLALPLVLGGCILSPRAPDGPPEGDVTDWETPITTTIVLDNLKAAFEGEGLQNYRDCFADTFRFHVDPQDSLDAGQEGFDRYANWVRSDEEHAANGIFGDAADATVAFTTVQQPDETTDTTYRIEDYVLTMEWESEGPHEEVVYKGRATLHMRRDNTGRWAIFRWVDRRLSGGTNETWGVLRGDYRD